MAAQVKVELDRVCDTSVNNGTWRYIATLPTLETEQKF